MSAEEVSELEKNLDAFQHQFPTLISQEEGRWAVGRHDSGSFTCWDTWRDALQTGYSKYQLKPFLVKKVERIPTIEYVSPIVRLCHPA